MIIWSNKRFVRLDVRRLKWLLPPLVRTSFPLPVNRNRLAVALCVLILYFPVLGLRGTVLLLSHKIPRRKGSAMVAQRSADLLYNVLKNTCAL